MNIENSGEFSGNSVQPQGKFLTNKIVSVPSNICLTQQGLKLQMNKVSENFVYGYGVLVTCYIALVDVE